MFRKYLLVVLCLVVLVTSLAFVGAASADGVAYVCYYSGFFGGWPAGSSVYSELYDGDGTLLRTRRAIAQTDNANFFLPVMMPRDGFEFAVLTIPGLPPVGGFFPVSDWILPDRDCSGGAIGDGRINDGGGQLGAPLAGFCISDGAIQVYDIGEGGAGTLAFTASADAISSALTQAAGQGSSVEIGNGLGDSLWAAADGTLALIGPDFRDAGKIYRFDFAGDLCGEGGGPGVISLGYSLPPGCYIDANSPSQSIICP